MKKRGFTLIELLIVIAIIAILAAILFPVFGRARENARRTSCASNLKQLGLGIMQYKDDYDNYYPYRNYGGTTPAVNSTVYTHTWWPNAGKENYLDPYLKSKQIYMCPSLKMPATPGSLALNNYAYSSVLGILGWHEAQLVAPAQMVMFEDTQTQAGTFVTYQPGQADWHNVFCEATNKTGVSTLCDEPEEQFYGRHMGTVNVAFADGHVKALRPILLFNNGVKSPYYAN